MRGVIALDIDGTITDKDHLISDEVADFFKELHENGWTFLFLTGRPLSFAMRTLPKLSFSYYLGVQNGSVLFEMPEKKEVERFYLSKDLIEILDKLHSEFEEDFLIYSGYEKGDVCYFRKKRFSSEMLEYLEKVEKLSDAPWISLDSFDLIDQDSFPLIKCLGSFEAMERLEKKLEGLEGTETCLIKDPLSKTLYLVLITRKEADKGKAAQAMMEKFSLSGPLITGGNDNNDLTLLGVGDEKIAIQGSPQKLLDLATIIAPPSEEGGIIDGIKTAIERLEKSWK